MIRTLDQSSAPFIAANFKILTRVCSLISGTPHYFLSASTSRAAVRSPVQLMRRGPAKKQI